MNQSDKLMTFKKDRDKGALHSDPVLGSWPVLIVDDEPDVHGVTVFALKDAIIFEKKIEFLHAYSAAEGMSVLAQRPDICVILLDVIMEEDDSGLKMVEKIREELGLLKVRIILRTGQPGQFPESETISKYDINDYKTKSELTHSKLLTTLTSALRSWEQIDKLETVKKGLEKIIQASNQFMEIQDINQFVDGVITQLAIFLSIPPEGFVCVESCHKEEENLSGCIIVAAAGSYKYLINKKISDITAPEVFNQIQDALRSEKNIYATNSIALYFYDPVNCRKFVSWVGSGKPIEPVDHNLLEIFCKNISLHIRNVNLIELLQQQAWEDSLLHIPNVAALWRFLHQNTAIVKENPFVIVILDIDHFSQINDFFGHAYGDELLKALLDYLRKILNPNVFISRIGPDVFGIAGEMEFLPYDILKKMAEMALEIPGGTSLTTACIGYTVLENNTGGIESLKNAALAVKRAKNVGLGNIKKYDNTLGEAIRNRSRLLLDLRSDVKEEQLYLVFQPQFSIKERQLLGFEALLRWKNSEGDFISPDIFIPLAEQGGLMITIGLWVLRQALHVQKQLLKAGFAKFRMAVNISAVQLMDPDFVGNLDKILESIGTDPAFIELEITESAAILGIENVVGLLNTIKERGVTLAIDDFGTGYSSLSTVEQWPIDRLKIDKSFVQKIGNDHSVRIIDLILPLAKRLSLKTIAEGVETEAQFDRLSQWGCDEIQGYLLGKPMNIETLKDWLKKREFSK